MSVGKMVPGVPGTVRQTHNKERDYHGKSN